MNLLINLQRKINKNNATISVLGLGYVGLPVAYNFSKKFNVIGFDINKNRVSELKNNKDNNNSISYEQLKKKKILFTNNFKDLFTSDIFIVTTPTPINKKKKPDVKFIFKALDYIIQSSIKNKLIILESTVYPGASKNIFIKYLEKKTRLKINIDFYFGYSPERINPGDSIHNFKNISKIVSGSDKKSCELIFLLYNKVVNKVIKSSSMLTAETAKLIENSQRDLNVAFVNEIAIICDKLKIKSREALKLASTKWNFLNFKPGLVGGHCIGVDPYYLFYSSKKLGYSPKTLLAGRSLNENFSKFLAYKFLKLFNIKKMKILVMGATYKADCSDLRNSKSFDICKILLKKKCLVDIYEPNIKILNYNGFKFIKKPKKNFYNGIIVSVDHKKFKEMGVKKILSFGVKKCKIFDIKSIFSKGEKILHI
jgi:UDP-N-acetyl-D-glucosamine/UDP-N-acetyl-D-galactosamine dehydrogenase